MPEVNQAAAERKHTRGLAPVHPLLFTAFPLLALYVHNIDQMPLVEVAEPILVALFGCAVVWVVCGAAFRNARKAAIATSAIAMEFLSYRHLLTLSPPWLDGWIAPVEIAALVGLFVCLVRTRQPLRDTTSVLNAASAFLVVSSLGSIGVGFWQASRSGEHIGTRKAFISQQDGRAAQKVTSARRINTSAPAKYSRLPDVYYIILDAYGRADRLKEFYGYDNRPFVHQLEKRGFYVASRSRANYNQTPLCIASALNMTYLDGLAKKAGPSGSLDACHPLVDDNAVANYLSTLGYHYVAIGSYDGEVKVETADLLLNAAPAIPVFDSAAMQLTPIGPHSPFQRSRHDAHRNRLLGVFTSLEAAAQLPYRKFVFAHLLAPHPPFEFAADGEAAYPAQPLTFEDGSWLLKDITREEYIRGYVGQLQYVNSRILETVDTILSRSQPRPVIILQGDHGSRMNLDWESVEKTDLREPFANLNAYLVPDNVRRDLYESISPVNSFRVILTNLYDAKFSLLPDRSGYSTADKPFAFLDVTARTEAP